MAHTYDSWIIWHESGNAVHFTKEAQAIEYFNKTRDAGAIEHVVKSTPCYKPERGYCGVCYPYSEHAGNPDYTESDAHIDPSVFEY